MTPERWQLVERLYHQAEALAPSERFAFVAKHCAGNEELRREVESLLAYADDAQAFMVAPAISVAAAAMGADGMTGRLVGERFGPYEIGALLGAGGMGEVYRARDSKLARDVAIKILPDAFTADANRRARFEREARLLAALNHPNIGAIYGLEDVDRGADALKQAQRFGYTAGDRETAQLADGYRSRAEILARAARTFSGMAQEQESLTRAAEAYRQALDLYSKVLGFAGVSRSMRAAQRGLTQVEQRIADLSHGTVQPSSPPRS